jgi:hypothetical protein
MGIQANTGVVELGLQVPGRTRQLSGRRLDRDARRPMPQQAMASRAII